MTQRHAANVVSLSRFLELPRPKCTNETGHAALVDGEHRLAAPIDEEPRRHAFVVREVEASAFKTEAAVVAGPSIAECKVPVGVAVTADAMKHALVDFSKEDLSGEDRQLRDERREPWRLKLRKKNVGGERLGIIRGETKLRHRCVALHAGRVLNPSRDVCADKPLPSHVQVWGELHAGLALVIDVIERIVVARVGSDTRRSLRGRRVGQPMTGAAASLVEETPPSGDMLVARRFTERRRIAREKGRDGVRLVHFDGEPWHGRFEAWAQIVGIEKKCREPFGAEASAHRNKTWRVCETPNMQGPSGEVGDVGVETAMADILVTAHTVLGRRRRVDTLDHVASVALEVQHQIAAFGDEGVVTDRLRVLLLNDRRALFDALFRLTGLASAEREEREAERARESPH